MRPKVRPPASLCQLLGSFLIENATYNAWLAAGRFLSQPNYSTHQVHRGSQNSEEFFGGANARKILQPARQKSSFPAALTSATNPAPTSRSVGSVAGQLRELVARATVRFSLDRRTSDSRLACATG